MRDVTAAASNPVTPDMPQSTSDQEWIDLGPCSRLLLLGGRGLLAELAEWARDQGCEVEVITSPRHSAELISSDGVSLAERLDRSGIKFEVADDINTTKTLARIGSMDGTVAMSMSAAWIFKPNILKEVFKNKLLNLHGYRLPQDRGGGGVSWQIMQGNRFGFCLVHRVDSGIDAGQIIAFSEFLYHARCRV